VAGHGECIPVARAKQVGSERRADDRSKFHVATGCLGNERCRGVLGPSCRRLRHWKAISTREKSRWMKTAALVAYRAASDGVGKVAFFLVTIAAARRLSSEEFGVFALGTTIGWMAVVASDFGLQMHLARVVARAPESAGNEFRKWLRVRASLAAGALLIVGLFLLFVGAGQHATAIVLFVTGYLAAGLVEFVHYFYRGLSRTDIESTLTLWQRLATLAGAGIALWLRPDPTTLAAAMVVPPVATAVYTVRLASGMGRVSKSLTPPVQSSVSEFVRDVAPVGAGVLFSALYFRIDVFLLEAWQGTETVGLYNAVFRIVEALRLFPAALLAVMLPRLVRAASPRPLVRMASVLTSFGVLVAAALWFAADRLVPALYGPSFAAAVPALQLLAISFPLMSLNYALTYQLIGWNGHRAYAALCLAALFFNVVLNARLIPAMSLNGAAWSTLATEALLTAGCTAVLARAKSWRRPAPAAAMAAT
jgi:O-antigen/teichoic acid export membrane protein